MERRKVVVTGMGTVNPTGLSVRESWDSIRNGRCGIGPITLFDASDFEVKVAGEVKNFDPQTRISRKEAKHMARFVQFAVYAAAEAMEQAGITPGGYADERAGVIVSSGIGGLSVIEQEHDRGAAKGYERVSPFFIPMTISNMAAARIAIQYHLGGMCSCPVTACAGGSNAIGDAFHRIRDGYEDVMICGGAEAVVTPLGIGGFSSMKALTKAEDPQRASIPFDLERSGFVMGEGAGILVLEEEQHALKRGAVILAEISGYASNCDAYHITAPLPDGNGAASCMRKTLKDAGISPAEVNYINAHGTSTQLNDSGETKAIRKVFGPAADYIPVSSTKSMTGHMLGAAGAAEAVFCVKALQDRFIPPTVGLKVKDPACDLDYVPGTGRKADLNYVLSNSFGFGGHNACLLFRGYK